MEDISIVHSGRRLTPSPTTDCFPTTTQRPDPNSADRAPPSSARLESATDAAPHQASRRCPRCVLRLMAEARRPHANSRRHSAPSLTRQEPVRERDVAGAAVADQRPRWQRHHRQRVHVGVDGASGPALPRECGREWWSKSRVRSWAREEPSTAAMPVETSSSAGGCCNDRRPRLRAIESSAGSNRHTATDPVACCASQTTRLVEEATEQVAAGIGGDDGSGDTGGVRADAATEDASGESNASLARPVLLPSRAD